MSSKNSLNPKSPRKASRKQLSTIEEYTQIGSSDNYLKLSNPIDMEEEDEITEINCF